MTSNNTISNELFELFLSSFMRTSSAGIEKQKPQKGIRFQHIKDPYNLTGNKDTEDNAYPECSICYKHIYRNAKQCSNPCGALYHSTCFETTIETQQENFDERDEDDEKEDPPKKDDRSNKSYLRTGENTKLNVRNRDKLSNPGFDKLAYDRKQDIRPKISEDFDINEYLEAQTIYSARMTGQIKKTLDMLGNTDDIYKGSKPKNKSVIISENNSSGDEDDET